MGVRKGSAALAVLAATLVAAPAAEAAGKRYVVVYRDGASLTAAHAAVRAAGGRIVRENRDVGVATVRARGGFVGRAAKQRALLGASHNRSIGSVPGAKPRRDEVESNRGVRAGKAPSSKLASPPPGGEPLSGWQWDMAMMDATPTGLLRGPAGHARRAGRRDRHRHPGRPPGHRAELQRRAQPQLHDGHPASSTATAPTIPTARARTRPTSTRTGTARTWRARSRRR